MRYLSEEWKRAAWDEFESNVIGGDTSDCGWGWDGPCGGCARCMTAQMSYYLRREEERARPFLDAGFDVLDPSVITIEWSPGYSAGHDAYNCRMAGEREAWRFPWEEAGGR